MKTHLHSVFGNGGLRTQLLRGGAGSIGIKVASVGLGLGLAVVLARSLGPENYGIYAYVYALVSLLAIPAQFGLPALVVRETAKAEVNRQWGLMRGLWRWSGLSVVVLALVLAVIAGILAWLFSRHFSSSELAAFGWGLLLVPLVALGALRGAALRGLRKVVQGQLPEQLIRPALLILLIASIGLFSDARIGASQAMALHALSAAVAFVIGAWLLRRGRPIQLAARPAPDYESRHWLASALPLALTAGMFLVNEQTDIVVLGILANAKEVGVYRIAAQGAMLVSLGFTAIGMATMPHFARFYASRDAILLQRLAMSGAGVSLLLALPVLVVFVFFGGILLRFIFGAGYEAGYLPLVILGGAHFLNVGFGMVGKLLNMSGHERDTLKGAGMAAICNVALNLILIPFYGMTGAAIASGASMMVWNIFLWRMVRRRLDVDSSIFGFFRKSRAGMNCNVS